MKSNDINQKTRDEIRALMQKALKENDTEGFYQAMDSMVEAVGADIRQEYENQINDLRQEMDNRILTARGVRQLTQAENDYYQKLITAMGAHDPKQAVNGLDVTMPKTVIESVFEDLRTRHPLLSKIKFVYTAGAVDIIMETSGRQRAVWGPITGEIVKELTGGFKKISTGLMKLSAFIPVAKSMLELGAPWMDRYIREILYETLANGLEYGIVDGDGKDMPIGMTRQIGDGVSVVGGKYPRKAAVKINDLSPSTMGNLISLLAVDNNGKPRIVTDLLLLVNAQDYYQKVMPATTVMAPDGTYRNNVMPYPMTVIPTLALGNNEAAFGSADRYFAAAASEKEGRIEYSDEYRFLEDERVYLSKLYANGSPKDDNSFLLLDISALQPVFYNVHTMADKPAAVATLASLKIGALKLSPDFSTGTKTYTAETTNETNTVMAIPSDGGADIKIMVGEEEVENGTPATWKPGSNTVTITVTAEDGTTTDTYTVTVTKS